MITIGMLVGGGFAITAVTTALKPKIGVALGCLSPILAFAVTAAVISLWPSGSSTDALDILWVPLWVSCGAISGVIVGIGLGLLRER